MAYFWTGAWSQFSWFITMLCVAGELNGVILHMLKLPLISQRQEVKMLTVMIAVGLPQAFFNFKQQCIS